MIRRHSTLTPTLAQVVASARRGAAFGTAWLLGLAGLVFLVGVAVYAFDRPAGSAYLMPPWLVAHVPGHSLFGRAGDWLPSFAHAFTFTALTAALWPATRWRPWLAAALWCAIGVGMEVGQHPALSARLAAALPTWFASVPVLDHLGAYWRYGGFDSGDVVAVVVACALAALLCEQALRRGINHKEADHVLRG
jgi:hypothetical protein